MVDRIADIWGQRTPHSKGTVWPTRVCSCDATAGRIGRQAEGVVPATCPIGWPLDGRRRATAYSDQQAEQPQQTPARVRGRSPTKLPS